MPPRRPTQANPWENKENSASASPNIPISVQSIEESLQKLNINDKPVVQQQEKTKSKEPANTDKAKVSDDQDDRPICVLDSKCYRKTAQHFLDYRHPSREKDTDAKPKQQPKQNPVPAQPDQDQLHQAVVIGYNNLVKAILAGKQRITTEEKRMLRLFRTENQITKQEHQRAVEASGWTTDEFEDGEKLAEIIGLVDLNEEMDFFRDVNAGDIHRLPVNPAKKLSKEHRNLFDQIAATFYQSIQNSDKNFTVEKVDVLVNRAMTQDFIEQRKQDPQNTFEEMNIYIGGSEEGIKNVIQYGIPDDNKKRKKPTISLFRNADSAVEASEDFGTEHVLMLKVLVNAKKNTAKKAVDKSTIVAAIPRYQVYFTSRDEEEREQES